MSGVQRNPGNQPVRGSANCHRLLYGNAQNRRVVRHRGGRALRKAHCARRRVREQLMNRREQYIRDPVAASRSRAADLLPRGLDS